MHCDEKNESLYFKYFKIKENFSFSKLKCKLRTFFLFKDIIFSQQPGILLGPLVRPGNVPAVGKQRSIHP